ncbi:MAG: hypothetical protein LAO78_06455 [Acidobacteriia bacterium]|nr:hypothetical protein [Terriglobia bacterium]
MSPPNGHANGSFGSSDQHSTPPILSLNANSTSQYTATQIKEFVALLEVPFDPGVIEWRVTNTSKGNGQSRGQVIPYADQRAYTDRLNALFTPAGWTRKYTVHTSANFQRAKDQKTTAKVFVTCDLTIFGIGSHSATGEEWADDANAGTSAEAQAFKRSCACFGLGRYLYYFTGIWVDLDDRKRPKTIPKLAGWAMPEGWRQGLRPVQQPGPQGSTPSTSSGSQTHQSGQAQSRCRELIQQIEGMAELLGKGLYRGLLKTIATAWKPSDITDPLVLERVLSHMHAAERGLKRLETALEKTGPAPLAAILRSHHLTSLDRVENLETLHKIVLALESNEPAK